MYKLRGEGGNYLAILNLFLYLYPVGTLFMVGDIYLGLERLLAGNERDVGDGVGGSR